MSEDSNSLKNKTENESYNVGYGKPPTEHRFQKGKSGNPKGRPRKTPSERDLPAMLLDEIFRLVPVNENGKAKNVPLIQIVIRNELSRAAKGAQRMPKYIIDLLQRIWHAHPPGELTREELKREMHDSRPILNLTEGADVPKNPIL